MDEDELASRHYPVEDDMRMQQRVWRFERVGWYALVLVVLLGLAGLFGNGPLIPDPAQRTCRHSKVLSAPAQAAQCIFIPQE